MCVNYLLCFENDKRVNDVDPCATQHGVSAMKIAAVSGHDEVLQALLDANANINILDKVNFPSYLPFPTIVFVQPCLRFLFLVQDGWTPLMAAASRGQPSIANALVVAGADMNIQSKVGTMYYVTIFPAYLNFYLVRLEQLL